MIYPSVFAFGLVAFGFLGMGPVTIAVDSYGPVTDNAQSVYELSLIEDIPNVGEEIEKNLVSNLILKMLKNIWKKMTVREIHSKRLPNPYLSVLRL